MTTALVFGKFYPPHRGHSYLIEHALTLADEVIVLVLAHPAERISVTQRVAWLTEIHPQVSVVGRVCDLPVDPADRAIDALWAPVILEAIGRDGVDVLVTSEASYGPNTARLLRARHEMLDPSRVVHPISASMVRADPAAHLDMLAPCVRAHYIPRIRFVGAESTGTTTLTATLAAHYDEPWVAEYGREYSVARPAEDPWTHLDLLAIAHGQIAREDAAAREARRVLFCDTDPLTTEVWHEFLIGRPAADISMLAAGRPYGLTVLTGDEIPFVQDGYRSDTTFRSRMQARIREVFTAEPNPLIEVHGSVAQRAATVIDALETLGIRAA